MSNPSHLNSIRSVVQEMFGKEARLVKAVKTEDGWNVEAEVVEESEHMKKIGIPRPVYDKNVYEIELDKDFAMISYTRKEGG